MSLISVGYCRLNISINNVSDKNITVLNILYVSDDNFFYDVENMSPNPPINVLSKTSSNVRLVVFDGFLSYMDKWLRGKPNTDLNDTINVFSQHLKKIGLEVIYKVYGEDKVRKMHINLYDLVAQLLYKKYFEEYELVIDLREGIGVARKCGWDEGLSIKIENTGIHVLHIYQIDLVFYRKVNETLKPFYNISFKVNITLDPGAKKIVSRRTCIPFKVDAYTELVKIFVYTRESYIGRSVYKW